MQALRSCWNAGETLKRSYKDIALMLGKRMQDNAAYLVSFNDANR